MKKYTYLMIIALVVAVVLCQTVALMWAWNIIIVDALELAPTKLTLMTAFGLGIFLTIIGNFFKSNSSS